MLILCVFDYFKVQLLTLSIIVHDPNYQKHAKQAPCQNAQIDRVLILRIFDSFQAQLLISSIIHDPNSQKHAN